MSLAMTREERERFLADLHVGIISIAEDGRGPLTVPIWYDFDPGVGVWVLTGRESRKGRLLAQTGRFSLCAQTETAPYQYVSVEGSIVETRPADVEKDARPMARRYLGREMGDAYVGDGSGEGDSLVFVMRPERWLTVDYNRLRPDAG